MFGINLKLNQYFLFPQFLEKPHPLQILTPPKPPPKEIKETPEKQVL